MTEPENPEGADRPRRRRKRRGPGSGWIPKFGGDKAGKKPFLPPRADHSHTGVLWRQVQEGTHPNPESVKPRRRRLVSRTFVALLIRWRYFVTAMVVMGLMTVATTGTLVGTRDAGNQTGKLPTLAAPSLESLDQSIELGRRFLGSLYKPLPGGMAVQSEASGVPFKAHFVKSDAWVLMGEEKEVCPASNCEASTSLEPIETGEKDEKYKITFNTGATNEALRVAVAINWAYQPNQFQINLTPEKVAEPVELWLDSTKLTTYSPTQKEKSSHSFRNENQSQMRMLRFTIRHATQEAYMYWSTYGRDPKKAAALSRFLESNGYTPGYDMRAPIFGRSRQLPDDLPFDGKAYPDCDHIASSSAFAYAYRSKVCLFRDTYLEAGARDPFLQAWQAFTTLAKYNDPNHELADGGWWLQGDTPRDVATHLQGQWNRTGYGIPKCTPFSCSEMSSIRTSVFGALQTELGYTHGNAASQKFADAAATMIVKTQIGPSGQFLMKDGTFYRPAQVGAYLAAWDTDDPRFVVPSTPKVVTGIAFLVTQSQPIPPEYLGLIPSNSETSFDALAFLYRYRCAKYKVSC